MWLAKLSSVNFLTICKECRVLKNTINAHFKRKINISRPKLTLKQNWHVSLLVFRLSVPYLLFFFKNNQCYKKVRKTETLCKPNTNYCLKTASQQMNHNTQQQQSTAWRYLLMSRVSNLTYGSTQQHDDMMQTCLLDHHSNTRKGYNQVWALIRDVGVFVCVCVCLLIDRDAPVGGWRVCFTGTVD